MIFLSDFQTTWETREIRAKINSANFSMKCEEFMGLDHHRSPNSTS